MAVSSSGGGAWGFCWGPRELWTKWVGHGALPKRFDARAPPQFMQRKYSYSYFWNSIILLDTSLKISDCNFMNFVGCYPEHNCPNACTDSRPGLTAATDWNQYGYRGTTESSSKIALQTCPPPNTLAKFPPAGDPHAPTSPPRKLPHAPTAILLQSVLS